MFESSDEKERLMMQRASTFMYSLSRDTQRHVADLDSLRLHSSLQRSFCTLLITDKRKARKLVPGWRSRLGQNALRTIWLPTWCNASLLPPYLLLSDPTRSKVQHC